MGFPSPAKDYLEERIDLNKELVKHPLSTFLFRCEGDSMINAFIPPKALLVVDRSLTPENGDIVVAVVNGQFTVRYLIKNPHQATLVPANKKYKDIVITPDMKVIIWGVVTTVLSKPKELRNVCFGRL